MSNAHLVAIKRITDTLEAWGEDVYLMGEDEPAMAGMLLQINTYAEAMANELAEAEARIERLQCYAEHLELYLEDSGLQFGFDVRGGCEDYRDHCGVQPGDMPNDGNDLADATPPESVTICNDDGTTSTFHLFGQLSTEGDDE